MQKKTICSNCHKTIKGKPYKIDAGKSVIDLCSKCYEKADSEIKKITTNENYLFAVLLGLIFGIVGSLIWFAVVVLTKYQIGFVAIGVGWIVGLGIFLGSGKKKSSRLQIIGAVVSFLSILFGEYLIANYYLVQYLVEGGALSSFTLLNPFYVVAIIFETIPENPLTLLFWGIAIWFSFSYLKPPKIKMAASLE